jgi:hypothetical protein
MEIKEIFSREELSRICIAWKAYAATKPEGASENHLFYTLVRAKDPLKAFQPLTNPVKIENNGGKSYVTLHNILYRLGYKLDHHLRALDAYANPTERNAYLRSNPNNHFYFTNGKFDFPLSAEQTNYLLEQVNSWKAGVDGK